MTKFKNLPYFEGALHFGADLTKDKLAVTFLPDKLSAAIELETESHIATEFVTLQFPLEASEEGEQIPSNAQIIIEGFVFAEKCVHVVLCAMRDCWPKVLSFAARFRLSCRRKSNCPLPVCCLSSD